MIDPEVWTDMVVQEVEKEVKSSQEEGEDHILKEAEDSLIDREQP